jgi:phosphomannomutase
MRPRAVLFDLDGTLAESKQAIGYTMGDRLSRLLKFVPVGIMSGGSFNQFDKQILTFLKLNTELQNLYLFPVNAAQCFTHLGDAWKPSYDFSFSDEERSTIMTALHDVLEATGIVRDAPQFGERIEDRGAQITFSALGQEAPLEVKQGWDPDHTKRLVIVDMLRQKLSDFEISMGGATSIDITHQGITKAYGVEWLTQTLDIPVHDMLYIGDALFPGGNDAVVKPTGIKTQEVKTIQDTGRIIEEIISDYEKSVLPV